MLDGMTVTELELDYITAVGELRRFNAKKNVDREIIARRLESIGCLATKEGDDWVVFENKECGIRAFFSNYPMKNKDIKIRPSLRIDFAGHFFVKEESFMALRHLLKFFVEQFGVFFKITRVDIRQDIIGAKYPFDYFPDFTQKEAGLVWALRSKPEINFYHDDATDKAIGFTIKTSRYAIKSYNRNINLDKKILTGEIQQHYYDYYKKLYDGRDVQRLEITMRQDACKLFNLLFFNAQFEKKKMLEIVMCNFGRNHALKHYDSSRPIGKWEVNDIFSELFFYEEREEVKMFRVHFRESADLNLSEVIFSDSGRSIEEIAKMLAKKICTMANGCAKARWDLRNRALDLIEQYRIDFRNIVNDKADRIKKGYKFMQLNMFEMERAQDIIHQERYLMLT